MIKWAEESALLNITKSSQVVNVILLMASGLVLLSAVCIIVITTKYLLTKDEKETVYVYVPREPLITTADPVDLRANAKVSDDSPMLYDIKPQKQPAVPMFEPVKKYANETEEEPWDHVGGLVGNYSGDAAIV